METFNTLGNDHQDISRASRAMSGSEVQDMCHNRDSTIMYPVFLHLNEP